MQRSQQSSKRSRSVEDDKEGHLVCRTGDWLHERCTATLRKTLPLLPPPVLAEISPPRTGGVSSVYYNGLTSKLPEADNRGVSFKERSSQRRFCFDVLLLGDLQDPGSHPAPEAHARSSSLS